MADPWKPNRGQSIDALYAWVATEPDGGQGIVGAAVVGMPGFTPLIGADRERIESYRHLAEMTRAASGYPVQLVRFDRKTVLESLGDGSAH